MEKSERTFWPTQYYPSSYEIWVLTSVHFTSEETEAQSSLIDWPKNTEGYSQEAKPGSLTPGPLAVLPGR